MERLIRLLGYEFIEDIKIKYYFKKTSPRKEKMKRKIDYYNRTGRYESKIILNKTNRLIDGYTTYLLAKKHGRKIIKVKRER